MSIGSTLLKLQELDLELARTQQQLKTMPELKELATKRKKHQQIKSEVTRLYAARKDADIELEELDIAERRCSFKTAEIQQKPCDNSDYKQVQELEKGLSLIAKELDKIAFKRESAKAAQVAALKEEARAKKILAEFEKSLLSDAQHAKEQAKGLQKTIQTLTEQRDAAAGQLPQETLSEYEKLRKQQGGLAVESIEGNVPSVCHTALQASSMDELRHAGELTHCPYCHRLLVIESAEE